MVGLACSSYRENYRRALYVIHAGKADAILNLVDEFAARVLINEISRNELALSVRPETFAK